MGSASGARLPQRDYRARPQGPGISASGEKEATVKGSITITITIRIRTEAPLVANLVENRVGFPPSLCTFGHLSNTVG